MLKQIISIFCFFFSFSLYSLPQIDEDSTPKICLTMIVKNESRIIERCLESVKDIVDCVSICDTGSTDNTVEIIEQFLQKNNIPGKIHNQVWKNFGYNRTQSAIEAQKTLVQLQFPLQNSFLLFLDADMLLEVNPNFNKKELTHDSYLMTQKNPSISYYNTRLVRASLPWECVGVTHEYWDCKMVNQNQILRTLSIDDRNDGGCKSDKFERDIKLLTQGLIDEPNNVRYMFYLAQSYRCLRQYQDAIKWYKARIEKRGWTEEVWYSKFMIGEIYEEMGFWDQALHWYLEAYNYFPQRAETLQKIATHYRLDGKNNLAHLFAKHGSRIPYPHNCTLFISHPAYNYQFDEELSIASYYTPYKKEGYEAVDRLILNKKAPQHIKNQAYKNITYYAEPIQSKATRPLEFALPTIGKETDLFYNPMNASIIKTSDGYQMICRTVNYVRCNVIDYKGIKPDEKLNSRNFLLQYDPQFKLLSQQEIVENCPRQWELWSSGIEDCRLFDFRGGKWFICTSCGTHSKNIGQTLCKLSDQPVDQLISLDKFIPLKSPIETRCEKNWIPFVKDETLYLIYKFEPFTLYKVNSDTGEYEVATIEQPPLDFSRFRGSTSPIPFEDGYLVLAHEVYIDNKLACYLHRLLFLDQNLKITKLSKPFCFKDIGVEFCCGMTMNHTEDEIIFAVSMHESDATLVFTDVSTVKGMLEPIQCN